MGDLVVLPEPMLVDALGAPLRSEPEFTTTFANAEHAALTLEAVEAAVRALLPPPPPPKFEWPMRLSLLRLGLGERPFPFQIQHVLDEPAGERAEGEKSL